MPNFIVIQEHEDWALPPIAEHVHSNCSMNVAKWSLRGRSKKGAAVFETKLVWLMRWARDFFRFASQRPFLKGSKVLCLTSHLPLLLADKLLPWGLGVEHIYLYNWYIRGLGNNPWVKKVLRWLLDNPRVTLMAQSPGEVQWYRDMGTRMEVCFVPYCCDVKTNVYTPGDYIFTGGFSNRDYDLVLELARRMPGQRFVLVASHRNGLDPAAMPSNVTLHRDLSPEKFHDLLGGSRLVIVPLKEDVGASGQMLALAAMAQGIPSVYAKASVIDYYFEGEPYIDGQEMPAGVPYVIGDIDSLEQGVRRMLDNPAEATAIGVAAKRRSSAYTTRMQGEMMRRVMKLHSLAE